MCEANSKAVERASRRSWFGRGERNQRGNQGTYSHRDDRGQHTRGKVRTLRIYSLPGRIHKHAAVLVECLALQRLGHHVSHKITGVAVHKLDVSSRNVLCDAEEALANVAIGTVATVGNDDGGLVVLVHTSLVANILGGPHLDRNGLDEKTTSDTMVNGHELRLCTRSSLQLLLTGNHTDKVLPHKDTHTGVPLVVSMTVVPPVSVNTDLETALVQYVAGLKWVAVEILETTIELGGILLSGCTHTRSKKRQCWL